jgi:protease YdgD
VLTAAHCLFNTRTNDWVRPSSLHFVVGQARDQFLGHSAVESFSTSPEFKFKLEDRPRYDFIAHNMIRHDWAIVTLQDALQVEPIPVRAVENAELPAADKGGEIALAGYAADRQYVLSVHKAATPGSTHPNGESSLICATPRRANPVTSAPSSPTHCARRTLSGSTLVVIPE